MAAVAAGQVVLVCIATAAWFLLGVEPVRAVVIVLAPVVRGHWEQRVDQTSR